MGSLCQQVTRSLCVRVCTCARGCVHGGLRNRSCSLSTLTVGDERQEEEFQRELQGRRSCVQGQEEVLRRCCVQGLEEVLRSGAGGGAAFRGRRCLTVQHMLAFAV